ncbi:glycosyltransferase family 61 protein [Marimonas lutisalis]|uniref:glycosyltransferase family 61 protein n=1 Tax=Marimonas lutisalis TaxID=2545756 RepID=UPI0010F61A8A|nr:glycosyltransferase family 61 protein [Marimonas lutisalis]
MTCREVPAAIIVPPAQGGLVQGCGVLDVDGRYLPRGATWRREKAITVEPQRKGPVEEHLPGRWLWGGVLFNHFGHFQVESTARLWPVPGLRDKLSGVVFAARDQTQPEGLRAFQADYLRLLIGDVPVRVVTRITQVDHLDVPGQAFGLGDIAFGTRVFRRFVDTHFARDIRAEGPERLFISRARQGVNKGGFVGEEILDDRMARAGYEVFHPERHDIATQVARYKAAERVVGLDGSALHLYAMVAKAPQWAAVILRRNRGASRSLRRHMERFTGTAPLVIEALARVGYSHGKKRLISALDFAAIGTELMAGGFLDQGVDWGPLSAEEEAWVADALARLEAR